MVSTPSPIHESAINIFRFCRRRKGVRGWHRRGCAAGASFSWAGRLVELSKAIKLLDGGLVSSHIKAFIAGLMMLRFSRWLAVSPALIGIIGGARRKNSQRRTCLHIVLHPIGIESNRNQPLEGRRQASTCAYSPECCRPAQMRGCSI